MDLTEEQIAQSMLCDRHWLKRQSAKLARLKTEGKPADKAQMLFDERLRKSLDRRELREKAVPDVQFENDLPIMSHRDEIVAALGDHQVIVVAGETGSGKSTQLPKICLDAGYGVTGFIGHTQPRRIAARTVAARIAEELKSPLGEHVGYKIRFQDQTKPRTFIKLMTDGILLAEAAGDRFLEQYEVIILDEAHERSLNIDFLLGMLHGTLQKRPELRLIITSATIDAERFGEHFGTTECKAPVIQVEGRTYPVEVRYRDLQDEAGSTVNVYQGLINAVHELSHEGDMLVFLPTERDIREAAKRLRADKLIQQQQREVLPLYARLSTAEQNKIFKPGAARRIVLATNVAESSLTVPRIHCVIDTGTARISRFSSRLRMQRLPIESVSQASADQRKGRCGRVGPGICVRLFSEEDFATRSPFTTPEIRRTNLASVILQAKYLKLGEVDKIPFLDPPRPETIREGYKTLFEIGAVDDHRRLTEVGRTLAKLPVDPRIGRIVLGGHDERCLSEVLIIAAALEVQDPRVRPIERQQAADEQHEQFLDERSDFLSYLKLWDFLEEKRTELSRGRFQKMCERMFLAPARIREWGEVHRQLRQTAVDHQLKVGKRPDEPDADAIHRALLTGLLSSSAHLADEREYTGAGGNKFFLWPGSGLSRAKPKWVVAAEVVETSRRFGRTVARIKPTWLESLGAHLTKHTYNDPHWHKKSQSVMAFENVSLFGLPVVVRRRVGYGHLDPETARRLFIEKGLVEQDMDADDAFFRNNAKVREEAEALAARTRKRDFILDEYQLYSFYNSRLPDDVYDMSSLRRAIKKSPELRDQICMSIDDLMGDEESLDRDAFPAVLDVGSMQLPLEYHFEPGAENDGVTVSVPVEALSQLHPEQLEWGVPGLLEQKLVALIRCLPKPIRRGLVPAPDTAEKVMSELEFGKGSFLAEVAKHFSQHAGETIKPSDFRVEKLGSHLRMRVSVVDEQGKEQSADRDLGELRKSLIGADHAETGIVVTDSEWHRDDVTEWDFGELPMEVSVARGGIEVTLFPAVVEFGDGTLGLRLEETRTAADVASHNGIRRMFQRLNRKTVSKQLRNLPRWNEIGLWSSSLFTKQHLEDQLAQLVTEVAFFHREKLPRTADDFASRQAEAFARISGATQEITSVVTEMMEAYHRVRLALPEIRGKRFGSAAADMESQIARMMHEHCLSDTPWEWLSQFPRYLRGIEYRIDKLQHGQAPNEKAIRELQRYWERLSECDEESGIVDRQALSDFRWMLEEYRISLFAQPLGTRVKVSPQRIEKQWNKTQAL